MTIRVFEAFAGAGSQRMALRNLGINHEVVAISDVDEFTVKSYASIHDNDKSVSQVTEEEMQDFLEKRNIPLNDKGVRKILKGKKLTEFYEACIKSNNLGDISKVETHDIPDHDLFTYSFPCTSVSISGKQEGLAKGSGTESSLLWECQKVIEGTMPKYLLMENVKNLVSKKFKPFFDEWLEYLEELGYTNYHQILNAKDYGVPQNRERVFVVSILGRHEPYKFPEPIKLELRLKDVLEREVDDKFYLSDEKTKTLIVNPPINESLNGLMEVGSLSHYKRNDINRVYSPQGNCPTLNTMQGGDRQPKVLIKNATKKGYIEAHDGDGVDLAYPDSETRRGRVQKGLSQTLDTGDSKGVVIAASRGRNPENTSDRTVGSPTEQRLEINKQGTSNTITTVQKDNYVVYNSYRIRKLTAKECWRLMGFSDDDFHKAEEVNSNSQLYKQAGNSIVVDVLEGIFKQLLGE